MKKLIALLLLLATLLPSQARAEEAVVTIAAAGDNLIHSSIFRDAKTADGYDFSPIYKRVSKIISSAGSFFVPSFEVIETLFSVISLTVVFR